jgi:hypothetical protein
LGQFSKNYRTFTQKIVNKLSKICIWDPGSGKNLFRIPDPGVKKAPDPGSGSATLSSAVVFFPTIFFASFRMVAFNYPLSEKGLVQLRHVIVARTRKFAFKLAEFQSLLPADRDEVHESGHNISSSFNQRVLMIQIHSGPLFVPFFVASV